MHLDPQIQELGYDFKDLLFQTESGEIVPKVRDLLIRVDCGDEEGRTLARFLVFFMHYI